MDNLRKQAERIVETRWDEATNTFSRNTKLGDNAFSSETISEEEYYQSKGF